MYLKVRQFVNSFPSLNQFISDNNNYVLLSAMKTAVTVLQEMMVKQGCIPEYEHIAQSGPQHQAVFEYRCSALGASVTATARSKKEAKQEAARLMLGALAARGLPVPAPFARADAAPPPQGPEAAATVGPRSYVALLQELCTEYRLAGAEYELVSDTGPPHLRHFTMAAQVGAVRRLATATTKKAARQLAAEMVYTYLRENLARLTSDFVEEEALVRAHEKAMERYLDAREETRRPDLGQRIADYHRGLATHIDADQRAAALRVLEGGGAGAEAEADASAEELQAALRALGVRAAADTLAAAGGGELHVLQLDATPPLAFAGATPLAARAAAARYLRRALRQRPPPPPTA